MAENSSATALLDPTSCAARSRALSMIGTCDHVDGWVLVEAAGAWAPQLGATAAVPARLRSHLAELIDRVAADHGLRLRPQFIKQARMQGSRVLLLFKDRLWSLSGGTRALLALTPEKLALLYADAVAAPLSRKSAQTSQNPALTALTGPQYFVCTHGQRDRCCGVLGLPLYRALRAAVQERAWQISHLGGHRFAPNVLVTPGGLLYGRVYADQLGGFLAAVEAGAVDFSRLRGRSAYPALVQAAEALLAEPGLRLLHVDGDNEAARVTFAAGGRKVHIELGRSSQETMVLASCGAATLKPYSPFAARS